MRLRAGAYIIYKIKFNTGQLVNLSIIKKLDSQPPSLMIYPHSLAFFTID